MTPVGLIGLLLSFAALPMASVRLSQSRLLLFLSLLIVHLCSTAVYYVYVLHNTADTSTYFYDGWHLARWPFKLGTVFTVKLVQSMRETIGGSYLDYFLIFQAIGFWGVVLIMRTFEEIHVALGVPPTALTTALLFIPGLHFWTSAIGKDAPLLFATSLAVWSVLSLRTRLIPFAIALGVMVLFRPHVALITAVSLALAAAVDARSSIGGRIGLLILALGGSALVAMSVDTTFNMTVSNPDSVADFFARKAQVNDTIAGTTSIAGASMPMKLFSQLYRPLFLDATGALGLIASVENVFFIAMTLFLLSRWRQVLTLTRSVFFLEFAIIFAATLSILLAMVFYNVGLGLRQKVMILPAWLAFFVANWAYYVKTREVRLVTQELPA